MNVWKIQQLKMNTINKRTVNLKKKIQTTVKIILQSTKKIS